MPGREQRALESSAWRGKDLDLLASHSRKVSVIEIPQDPFLLSLLNRAALRPFLWFDPSWSSLNFAISLFEEIDEKLGQYMSCMAVTMLINDFPERVQRLFRFPHPRNGSLGPTFLRGIYEPCTISLEIYAVHGRVDGVIDELD